ncbi:hypothetical protein PFISCL1PPCAC_14960 [Pristionchus fissidentatus]|uniref:glucuronosyltransferase n=1 Tax=Pristionchus fissidentatus TaxID=1538716 RepID=A0AAV5VZ57_9BILA|nr:hypothetical protein PFISCL1PPCAC_14960 [Pristionchus fissidentatus]
MILLPLFFLSLISLSNSFKIAIFASDITSSQNIWNKRIANILSNAGHDVVVYVISSYNTKPKMIDFVPAVKADYVNASTPYDIHELMKDANDVTFYDVPFYDSRQKARAKIFSAMIESCEPLITNKTFIESVKSEKFDVAFAHMYTYCNIGVIHLTGIPSWIWLNSAPMAEHIGQSIGLPMPPSYCSHMMQDAGEEMYFIERIKSWFANILTLPFIRWGVSMETAAFRKHYGEDFPDLFELGKQAPLVMVNTVELYDFARPTLAKIVNIGGIGLNVTGDAQLTGEYGRFVDESVDGFVVMTFGSIAPAHLMPKEWKRSIVMAFSRFPRVQFFIRYEKEDDEFTNKLPKNAHVSKWLPQGDLLKHPKCLGLITHAGYNSLQDVFHSGIPAITIPLFGDQPRNARLAEKLGVALRITKPEMMSAIALTKNLDKLISDKSLSVNARRLRRQIELRPMSSDALLIKWTQFIAEFKTVDNLVPYGVHLNSFVYHSLDVILFVFVTISFFSFLIFRIFYKCYRCVKCFIPEDQYKVKRD